ncbi:MAG: 2-hydroxychromene-2-carboxylate isomerase [Betaproteobacteria bacterium]|nr:2-hydroxychromene-2-carboxylate isomerase [Betaproteobacteria bacterium]
MMTPIEFYFDFISPYGYLGSTQIEAVAARHGRVVDWKPVLIGITILKVMGSKPLLDIPLKGDYLRDDGPRMAALLGVPFRQHSLKGINSVAASRAFLWLKARDAALAVRFAQRIYRRLWVDNMDITPPEAAADEAAALGVDRAQLLVAIATPEIKQKLKDAVDAAMSKGVFGVPFFIADGEPIWGGDRLWMLEHWLEYGRWAPAAPG